MDPHSSMNVTRKQAQGPKGLDWSLIFAEARRAGLAAANAHVPQPMIVQQRANPMDDNSPVVKTYAPVMDGVCGFAWITIRPGNSQAAVYAKKHLGASPGYGGGMQIWVSEFGQSYERKYAYASAFADALKRYGVQAYADGRLD